MNTMASDDNCKEEESALALLEMKGSTTSPQQPIRRATSPQATNQTSARDMRSSLAKILNNPMPAFSHTASSCPIAKIDIQSSRHAAIYSESGLVTPGESEESDFDFRGLHRIPQPDLSRSQTSLDLSKASDALTLDRGFFSMRPVLSGPKAILTPPYGALESPPQTACSIAPLQYLQEALKVPSDVTEMPSSKRHKAIHDAPAQDDLDLPDRSPAFSLPSPTELVQGVQQRHGWSAVVDKFQSFDSHKGRSKRKRDCQSDVQQRDVQLFEYVPHSPASDSHRSDSTVGLNNVSGVFKEHEIEALTNFMTRYCETNNITQYELNDRIQETSRSIHTRFWDQVTAVLPYRKRQSVYKVCRRRFHNFGVRGKWTADEDAALKAAQAKKPNQWKAIGEMINRMPEDCRDRWRNYLKCGDNRKQDVWTEQEEMMLREAVQNCFTKLRTDPFFSRRSGLAGSQQKDVSEDNDKNLNWTYISEQMGGIRSRLQCQYKWPKLKKRDLENERIRSELHDRLARGLPAEDETKKTWRAKRAELNYAKMMPGDKLDLLNYLKETGTLDEQNIPWKLIGKKEICSKDRWTLADCKTAYRKMKSDFNISASISDLGHIVTLLQDHIVVTYSNHLHDRYTHPESKSKQRRPASSEVSSPTGSDYSTSPTA